MMKHPSATRPIDTSGIRPANIRQLRVATARTAIAELSEPVSKASTQLTLAMIDEEGWLTTTDEIVITTPRSLKV